MLWHICPEHPPEVHSLLFEHSPNVEDPQNCSLFMGEKIFSLFMLIIRITTARVSIVIITMIGFFILVYVATGS